MQFAGLPNREVGGPGAPEDFVNVGRHLLVGLHVAGSIRHQFAVLHLLRPFINRRQSVLRSQIDDLLLVPHKKRMRADDQRLGSLRLNRSESAVVVRASNDDDRQLDAEQ
jgi:hypothetical protein